MADEDLDARVGELEREVARLRAELREASVDAKAARVLASGADRDAAEVRAQLRVHLSLLTALRDTQREQGEQITGLRQELRQELRREVGGLRTEVREGSSTLAVGTAQITALLTRRERGDGDGG